MKMSKFKRVLSDDWLPLEFKSGNEIDVTSIMVNKTKLKSIMEQVEQAVLAKIYEQEPVAWHTEGHLSDKSATTYEPDVVTTYNPEVVARWEYRGWPVKPLYAHPCVPPTSNKTACVSESGESATQTSNQANLDSSSQEKIQIISLLKSLRLEFGAVGTRDIDVMEKNKRIDAAIEAIENHIPDTGKMVCENCQYLPDGSSLVDEVKVMVEMLEDKEWAEHIGKTELGSRLERAVSALHNELLEVQGRHISIDGGGVPDGWQLVPIEPTENQIVSAMDASVLGRPSVDDETYVMSIIDAYLKAAPKYTGDK